MSNGHDIYKVVTYVTRGTDTDSLLECLRDVHVNRIGDYENCMTVIPCIGTWQAGDDTHPHIGMPSSTVMAKENRIEFVCSGDDLRRIISTIRKNHPYEEPEIDVYPLADIRGIR